MKQTAVVAVSDVAFGGKGVARHEGKVFFIPFTAVGDVVKVRVTRDKKKFAEAEVEEIITPSPDRVAPKCKWYGQCGGCGYQHISYASQLALKQRQVEQTLRRVGRLDEVPMRAIVPSPEPYAYRNRIRVHVSHRQAGFFAHSSHELVPVSRCEIAKPGVNEALHDLRRAGVQDGDYTLVAESERGRFFEQTNDAVAAEMLALVESLVPAGHDLLVDAYCGAGFFAHRLAPKFGKVVGIEENQYAVEHARRTAAENESFIAGDVAEHLADVLAPATPATTTLLLDPPAIGITPRVVDHILASAPASLIYISCNPATLARDLSSLASVYRVKSVTPLDMFPQTAEVEVVVELACDGNI
ncbi:MAG: rRNA (uracil-5-)-methyltransferase RumA [Verrucomicrobiota bacterium]|jgi:23S rRNA (uracil1939-C5)-methyltransferase